MSTAEPQAVQFHARGLLARMRDPFAAGVSPAAPPPRADDMLSQVDFAQMNPFLESFLAAVGLPVAIIDLNGRVLASSRWQRLCTDFHRVHPTSRQRCMESGHALSARLDAGEAYAIHRCHNGLTDCALPIVMDGRHIANLFTGQFLLQAPDMAQFQAQQAALGFAADDYFSALADVPVVEEGRLKPILEMLSQLVQLIARLNLSEKAARAAQADSHAQMQAYSLDRDWSEARYRNFFDLSPVGIAVNDYATGQFIEVNQALIDSVGYSAEDFAQLSYWDLTPRDYEAQEAAQLDSLRRTGRYGPYEKEYIHRLGHRVPVLLHGRLIEGNRIYSIVQDISERKRNESVLQASEARFRRLFERNRSVKLIIDPAGGRIEDANPAACAYYGYTRDELLGKRISDINVATPEAIQSEMSQAQAESRMYFNFRHRLASGEIRDVEVYSGPIETEHGLRLYSIIHDVTDKKRAFDELAAHRLHLEALVAKRTEELTAAKAAAEAANRAKSSFLSNMSHEIRTPMNAILGMTYLLSRSQVDARQADQLKKIETAGEHLLHIINDILDLSKIEAGKLTLEETPLSIDAVVDKVATIVSQKIAAKGLRFIVDGERLPDDLVGDPTRLCQALLNYVGNAVKFTERGSITVRTRQLALDDRHLLLKLEVIDTGIGIPPARLGAVFHAFEQSDSSTTREYGGTGLGLAITRHLAQLMGGEAGAESTPGVGSTFWFTVRLARQAAAPQAISGLPARESADQTLARIGHRHRILLVDDEPINREIIGEFLEGFGLHIDMAEDGLAAVDAAARQAYDLILMDMQMPRLDGLDATRRIRALPDRPQVPIVAMTANAFVEDRQRCLAAGMNDHLPKPIEPEMLFSTVLRWLQTQPAP